MIGFVKSRPIVAIMIAFFVGLGAFGCNLLVGFPRPHNPRVFGVPEKTEWAAVGVREKLGNPGSQEGVQENLLGKHAAGFWGVPSFSLLDAEGKQIMALWGQDRLWLIARAIRRELTKAGR